MSAAMTTRLRGKAARRAENECLARLLSAGLVEPLSLANGSQREHTPSFTLSQGLLHFLHSPAQGLGGNSCDVGMGMVQCSSTPTSAARCSGSPLPTALKMRLVCFLSAMGVAMAQTKLALEPLLGVSAAAMVVFRRLYLWLN